MEPIESSLHQSTVTLADVNPSLGGEQSSPLLLPPEKGILDENCGAMLFVVVTKSDLYTELNAEQQDKVQYHVRQFCLRHGAALIYTSAKEELNIQMLHKYIAHRIYALPFTMPAYIVEKDRIFVPTGWDSEQKLSIVKDSLGFGNSEVPMLAQQNEPLTFSYKMVEKEVEAEDEQAFLLRLASMATDGPSAGTGGQQSPRRDAGKAPGDSNNTMLANFFSSLLTKDNIQRPPSTHSTKSGSSPAPSVISQSVDTEGHFQKMLAGTKAQQQQQQRTASMASRSVKEEDGGSPQNGDGDEDNEEFEDAPEGDGESYTSSIGSQNPTPRSGGETGGSSTELPNIR